MFTALFNIDTNKKTGGIKMAVPKRIFKLKLKDKPKDVWSVTHVQHDMEDKEIDVVCTSLYDSEDEAYKAAYAYYYRITIDALYDEYDEGMNVDDLEFVNDVCVGDDEFNITRFIYDNGVDTPHYEYGIECKDGSCSGPLRVVSDGDGDGNYYNEIAIACDRAMAKIAPLPKNYEDLSMEQHIAALSYLADTNFDYDRGYLRLLNSNSWSEEVFVTKCGPLKGRYED